MRTNNFDLSICRIDINDIFSIIDHTYFIIECNINIEKYQLIRPIL